MGNLAAEYVNTGADHFAHSLCYADIGLALAPISSGGERHRKSDVAGMNETALLTKRCTKCGAEKALDQFHCRRNGRAGRHAQCKECRSQFGKSHRNPAAAREHRLRRYGLDTIAFDRLLCAQGGKCAICGTTEYGARKGVRHFAIDHAHHSRLVRGLLCRACNTVLGLMGDDPERLEAAARYLRGFKRG